MPASVIPAFTWQEQLGRRERRRCTREDHAIRGQGRWRGGADGGEGERAGLPFKEKPKDNSLKTSKSAEMDSQGCHEVVFFHKYHCRGARQRVVFGFDTSVDVQFRVR